MAAEGNEQDACVQHVLQASQAENEAIALDREGNVAAAITKYEACERELAAAIEAALPAHEEDQPKLAQHRQEISERLTHLRGLQGGTAPTIPVEQQIRAVELGMRATGAASSAATSAGGAKTLAACAALGAAGGFLVLGGVVGTSLAVVGGAAGAAYVATREDKLGDAARNAGGLAIAGAQKAKQLNEEHQITAKAAEAGTKALTTAKDFDQKHGITEKISRGIGQAVTKAQEIENKHQEPQFRPGDTAYFVGLSLDIKEGYKLVYGQAGRVLGPITRQCHLTGKGVWIRFPGNRGRIGVPFEELSPSPPAPLPGGHEVGARLRFTGQSLNMANCGSRLAHGEVGTVLGPCSRFADTCIVLKFPGIERDVYCPVEELTASEP